MLAQDSGLHRTDRRARAGPAQPADRRGPRQDRALRHQRRRRRSRGRRRPSAAQAATQVIQGEKLFDLVVRMEPQFRTSAHEIGNLLVGTPAGQQIPLSRAARSSRKATAHRSSIAKTIRATSACSTASKAATWSAPSTTARRPCSKRDTCRRATGWIGAANTANFSKPKQQLYIIGPLAVLLIFLILFALYGNFKFPVTIALGVVMTEPVGALIALKLTHTPFSVSSRAGPAGAAGRFGRDRRHSGHLHQQAAAGGHGHPRRPRGKPRCCACVPS